MGMFGPGKEGWLAEAEMLSWAFRHLKGEERDYLTKRLKHVLGYMVSSLFARVGCRF